MISTLFLDSKSGRVTLDNNGVALRDPIHVSDITAFIWSSYVNQVFAETFHIGGGLEGVVSLLDICKAFNPSVHVINRDSASTPNVIMDISKARALTGWNPMVSFLEWTQECLT